MKTIKSLLIVLIVLMVGILLWPTILFAAGSWASPTHSIIDSQQRTVTFVFTGDSGGGTVPSLSLSTDTLSFMKGYWLCLIETKPGTTAPTNLYDITLTDALALDILGGAGADRSNTITQKVYPVTDSSKGCVPLDGTALTLAVSGTTVNSATGTIKFYLSR